MWRAIVVAGLIVAGCSGARIERTSDQLGGVGPRWGLVSFTGDADDEARQLMVDYCHPLPYRVTGDAVQDRVLWARRSGHNLMEHRTFIRFECLRAASSPTAGIDPGVK